MNVVIEDKRLLKELEERKRLQEEHEKRMKEMEERNKRLMEELEAKKDREKLDNNGIKPPHQKPTKTDT